MEILSSMTLKLLLTIRFVLNLLRNLNMQFAYVLVIIRVGVNSLISLGLTLDLGLP